MSRIVIDLNGKDIDWLSFNSLATFLPNAMVSTTDGSYDNLLSAIKSHPDINFKEVIIDTDCDVSLKHEYHNRIDVTNAGLTRPTFYHVVINDFSEIDTSSLIAFISTSLGMNCVLNLEMNDMDGFLEYVEIDPTFLEMLKANCNHVFDNE